MERIPQDFQQEKNSTDSERALMSVLEQAEQTLTQLSSEAERGNVVSPDALKLALAQVQYAREQAQTLEDRLDVAEKDARVDHLTGLLNRRAFEEDLQRAYRHVTSSTAPIERHTERTPRAVHIVGIDVDDFKDINDTYGHGVGDKYLIAIAKELQETIARSGDIIARTGGDEFSALLLDTDASGVAAVAERIARAVEIASNNVRSELARVHGVLAADKGNVSASIGFAELNPEKDTPADVLQRADYALYVVKAVGKRGALSDTEAKEYDNNGELRKSFLSEYENGAG